MRALSVIILNYNTKNLTVRAIQSVLDLPTKDIDVIVVDNASTDGSQDALRALSNKEQRVRFMPLSANLGFAAGNNVALREIETPYIMLLNSDAYFPTGSDLSGALACFEADSNLGMLTPYVELGTGTIDPACHRGIPTPWNALTYFTGLEKVFSKDFFSFRKTISQPSQRENQSQPRAHQLLAQMRKLFGGYHQTWKDVNQTHEIDACSGAAMILRTESINEIGLLDEQFFMYGEDLDWCYRIKQAEWKIRYFPDLTVIHEKHSSGLKKRGEMRDEGIEQESFHQEVKLSTKQAFYDAMKLFYQKHHVGPAWMENAVLLGVHFISKLK